MEDRGLAIGWVSRPHPDETANGDSWVAHWHADVCRLAVVDGLGHGPAAALAARAAVDVLGANPELAPEEALLVCHGALKGTRGAAMAICAIDVTRGHLSFAGVGNVDVQLLLAGSVTRLVSHRGIVGAAFPRLRGSRFDLGADWIAVLHTDGVSARFNIRDVLDSVGRRDAQALAEYVLAGWARPSDDATVVVVTPDDTGRPAA